MGLGRAAVVLSIIFHVVGFFVIVGVPRLLASGPDPGKVYVVDLVTLPGPAGPAPAAAAPPASGAATKPAPPKEVPKPAPPKTPPVKKAPDKAIVIPERGAKKPPPKAPQAKPKETPKPVEPAETDAADDNAPEAAATEPAPASPAPATANPNPAGVAPGAGGGGEGQGTGGGGDAYTFYLGVLKQNIERAWKRPVYTGDSTLTATVNLRISSAGRVQKLDLKTSSGFEPLDRSLLTAVRAAEPFPPFPAALAMPSLQVQIVFELTPEEAAPENPGD
jgi:TonB family protein